jgi:hypothetical protein
MQETENTEGTVKFKRMEFDTRGWSTEKIEKLCKKLKSEGYVFEERESKGLSSITTWEDGTYRLYDQYLAVNDYLTTYEEYMGEEVKSSMREVVLTHDTVSIENVIYSQLYGVKIAMSKAIIYQSSGVYTYSDLSALGYTKLHTFNSLEEVIKFCLGKGYKVYEFDNSEDLLHWLLEK